MDRYVYGQVWGRRKWKPIWGHTYRANSGGQQCRPIDKCHTMSGSIFEGGTFGGAYGVLWLVLGGCFLPTWVEHMFDKGWGSRTYVRHTSLGPR